MKGDSTSRVDDQSTNCLQSRYFQVASDAGVARRDLVGPWNVSTAGLNAARRSRVGATEGSVQVTVQVGSAAPQPIRSPYAVAFTPVFPPGIFRRFQRFRR